MKLGNFDFSRKLLHHPDHLVNMIKGKRSFPITIEIDLTNTCNHRCGFCNYAEHLKGPNDFLDFNTLKILLSSLKSGGAKGITFTGGGEPTLHPQFDEVIDLAAKEGFDIGLITNGSAITEKRIIHLSNKLSWVRVSMAGGEPLSYSTVQGVDHFHRVIDNIKTLLEKQNEFEERKTDLGIRILVTPDNINTLEMIYDEFSVNLSPSYIQFAPDQYTEDCGLFWNSTEVQSMLNRCEAKGSSLGIDTLTSGYVWIQDDIGMPNHCYARYFHISIEATGNVNFCKNARSEPDYVIGNIYEDDIQTILDSSRTREIESWVRPSNCGLYCKHLPLNIAVEGIVNPKKSISKNFVG